MRTAALILGIMGSLAGFGGSVLVLTVGGIGGAFGGEGAGTVIGLGSAGLAISFVALVAATLALAKPKGSGVVMILAGIAGFLSISVFYVIPGLLLVVAGILAMLGAREVASRSRLEGTPDSGQVMHSFRDKFHR